MEVIREAKITKLDLMKDYANNLVTYIWEELDRDFNLDLGNYEGKVDTQSSVDGATYNIIIYNMDNLPEELSPNDKSIFEKAFNYYINEYISSNNSPIENKKVKLKNLNVVIPENGNLPESNWISNIIGSNHRMVIYFNLAFSNDMPQWSNVVSIDDVAKSIGKFGPESYFDLAVYENGVRYDHKILGEVKIPVKYKRDALSFGNGFKYWDRFKKIGKIKDIYKNTKITLAAEYTQNSDIILMWTQLGAYLLDRKDFEEGIQKIRDILNGDA